MSLSKYESEVKHVALPQAEAFARFSDLNNLGALRERLNDPDAMAKLAGQVPADKMEEARKYLEGMQFDADTLTLSTPVGGITMRIVEREEPKLVKMQSEGSPLPLYIWIQLLPTDEANCKMRVTVGAEVNMFMRGMVSKPLQQAADGLANILSAVR